MSESVQKKLSVVKPPRIKITYDIETNGAKISKELPAIFGIIGDFSGMRDDSKPFLEYSDRHFINVNPENFNNVLKSLTPRVVVPIVELDGTTTTNLELIFETIQDFKPINLVKKIDTLFKIYSQKKQLSELKIKYDLNKKNGSILETMLNDTNLQDTLRKQIASFLNKTPVTVEVKPGDNKVDAKIPDGAKVDGKIPDANKVDVKPAAAVDNKSTPVIGKELGELLDKITTATEQQKKYLCTLVDTYITIIQENSATIKDKKFIDFCNGFFVFVDQKITNYLNQILHNKHFQKIEGHWRGVEYMMSNMLFTNKSQLRIFNASTEEIFNDLTGSMEFDQSHLFKKIYESEYGTYGGTPYTSIMWDHYISRSSVEFNLLTKITEVMAAAHCPLVLGVDPSLFDMPSFEYLPEPHTLSGLFDSVELSDFNSFRQSDDAKYVTFVMPRIMARVPYSTKEIPVAGLHYIEEVNPLSWEDYTWMNGAYAYFTKITNSYAISGWFSSICGVENGGKIDNLPLYIYKTKHGDYKSKCPTEVEITDRREKELADLGFITICHSKNSNYAVLFSNNNSFKAPFYQDEGDNNNAQLATKAPYMMNVSRFAHYLKCIMRDKIGSFTSKKDVEAFLSNWLAQYTLLDDKAPASLKAKYPLREFKLRVEEIPGKQGYYNAVMLLRPHDELEGLEISLRLVQNV